MRDQDGFQPVEDYTNAFLGVFYLLLVMTLVVIWGAWGYVVSLALCAGLHWTIRHFSLRRAAREAAWDARVEAVLARRQNPEN